jgi:hypothetical protein
VVAVDVETIKIHTMIVSRNMSGAITMVPMTATTMINAMVVVAYIVGGVVMAAETLKETILTRTNDTCQMCGKVGHIALNYWKRL